MSERRIREQIFDMISEDVLSMSEEELDAELREDGLDPQLLAQQLKSQTDDLVLAHKKKKFSNLREQMQQNAKTDCSKSGKLNEILSNAQDAKDALIKMFSAGLVPRDLLTGAFRDGEDITNDDAESMIEDLLELGVFQDEKK